MPSSKEPNELQQRSAGFGLDPRNDQPNASSLGYNLHRRSTSELARYRLAAAARQQTASAGRTGSTEDEYKRWVISILEQATILVDDDLVSGSLFAQ